MEDTPKRVEPETAGKYFALISTINEIEKRMGWADLIYLTLNLVVFLFIISFVSNLMHKIYFPLSAMDLLFVLFSLVIGMAICVYWAASAIRLQLKLKLRYFQVRFLERKMNCIGECIFSDESIFFDPDIRRIDSPDNKETLYYPTSGIARMDGFIGSAKPRYFSWIMPIMFFVIYWIIFIWINLLSFA
jgi:hypothetical protein